MSWITAKADIRIHLNDGPTDRYHFRKRCFGELNSVNTRFKTFEFRRITDLTKTQGVFINGVLQPLSAVSEDSVITGEFILTTPPQDGDIVEASYYTQWFLDAELENFLSQASRWLMSTADYTQVGPGLVPSALEYASHLAYKKMAQRWRDYMSSVYKVEDAPKDEASGRVDSFIKMADTAREEALKLRDEFYKRQGQPLQPLFGTVVGNVRSMP
jgi:hypothetical protein